MATQHKFGQTRTKQARKTIFRGLILVLAVIWEAAAQSPATEPKPQMPSSAVQKPGAADHPTAGSPGAAYVLGPGDQIVVQALRVEEITDKEVPIDMNGEIRLPVAGRIAVAGMTVAEAEAAISKRLQSYVLRPDVTVYVKEFRSQPISVLGAVKSPGVQQVQSGKTLFEMLSLAGGLDVNAGATLKLTRKLEWGRIPLPGAADDETGQFSVAEVNLKSIMEGKNPAENILIRPYDVISVPKADTIYVIGEVQKSGGFLLSDVTAVTVLQAVSMAGGLSRDAKGQDAKILRRAAGASSRDEIAVNLRRLLDGKTPDVAMQAEDILYVPSSVSKKAGLRALEAAVQAGTGVAIWRIP